MTNNMGFSGRGQLIWTANSTRWGVWEAEEVGMVTARSLAFFWIRGIQYRRLFTMQFLLIAPQLALLCCFL